MTQTTHPRPVELLAPAGGFEQLRYAIRFGADAVYLGCDRFGLRSRAGNFTLEELPQATAFAHEAGVKVHVTVNALMFQDDLADLPEYLRAIEAAGADAAIVSDLGAFALAREHAPGLELHVSTQASVANAASAKMWHSLGAKRVVCAREMTLDDIARMRDAVPDDLEIEAFVHGAMCMAHSGRCLISDYLAGRPGNKGECAQPCRWTYTLVEERRPDQPIDVESDERGSYVMSSCDLNMVRHLDELRAAGVDSLKIEGRNKKAFYVATVVGAYRRALDGADPEACARELDTVSHRPYATGFYFGRAKQAPYQEYLKDCVHAATVESCEKLPAKEDIQREGGGRTGEDHAAASDAASGTAADAAPETVPEERYVWTIRCHNRLTTGNVAEVVSPLFEPRPFRVGDIDWIVEGGGFEPVASANRSLECYRIEVPFACEPGDLIRLRVDG